MARVTVEDCIDKVPNRFDLVLLASHRARGISQGAPLTVERDNDKNPVVALREVADVTIDTDDLQEDLIHSMQKHTEVDEPEPDAVPRLMSDPSSMMLGNAQHEFEQDTQVDSVSPGSEEELARVMRNSSAPADSSRSGF